MEIEAEIGAKAAMVEVSNHGRWVECAPLLY